jgi:DNA (cytosine-5)-methyltransferase 1
LTSRRSRGTVLSVFSGAGGLDLGLERAAFDPLLCLDSDPTVQSVLRLNRPQWHIPEDGDVTTAAERISRNELGISQADLDLLAGGPPCQPFSKAAQWTSSGRSGLGDPRARSLTGMMSLVAKFLPRALLIENVPGFVSGETSALRSLQIGLAAINASTGTCYKLQSWIADAADYGVPQHRKRAIITAFRDGRLIQLPTPTHHGAEIRSWDALHDYVEDSPPRPTGSWTALLPSIPEGHNYQWLTKKGGGPELFGWRTRYWSFLLKLAKDRPSWTLPASPGPNTGPFHWDNRPLSTRERLRLQSFPDEWLLTGSQRVQWRMAGNATPPLLAEVVGRAIGRELGICAHMSDHLSLSFKQVDSVPPAAEPQIIDDRFIAQLGPKPAHPGVGQGPAPRAKIADKTSADRSEADAAA